MSALKDRFPFLDRTSQMQDMEKTFGPISVLIPYYFYSSLLANKGCKFSLLSAGSSSASIYGFVSCRC